MGIDLERFINVNPELVCCICTGVLVDPVESPCRHVFCCECIETWLHTRPNCPTCRSDICQGHLKPVLPMITNIIGNLQIRCDYVARGCKKAVALESLRTHCDKCKFAPVECPHKGCEEVISRKDLGHHKGSCPKRMVTCQKGCELEIEFEVISEHNCVKQLKKIVNELNKKLTSHETRLKNIEEEIKHLNNEFSRMEECQQSFVRSNSRLPLQLNPPSSIQRRSLRCQIRISRESRLSLSNRSQSRSRSGSPQNRQRSRSRSYRSSRSRSRSSGSYGSRAGQRERYSPSVESISIDSHSVESPHSCTSNASSFSSSRRSSRLRDRRRSSSYLESSSSDHE